MPASDSPVVERKLFLKVTAVLYARYDDAAIGLSNATVTRVMAAGGNVAFKIVAKPLQIGTWLLLTAYGNSSSPYITVPSPTPYGVPFNHNTARLA